jgi:hypothetical protein
MREIEILDSQPLLRIAEAYENFVEEFSSYQRANGNVGVRFLMGTIAERGSNILARPMVLKAAYGVKI